MNKTTFFYVNTFRFIDILARKEKVIGKFAGENRCDKLRCSTTGKYELEQILLTEIENLLIRAPISFEEQETATH